MIARPLHLSKTTTYQLSRLPKTVAPLTAIFCFDTIIGLCRTPTLPSRLSLPGGVRLSESETISAQEAVGNTSSELPQVVALRHCARIRVPLSDVHSVNVVAEHDQFTIGGKFFPEHGTLRQIVSETGMSTAWDVVVFRRISTDMKGDGVGGLVISQEELGNRNEVVVEVDVMAYCGLGAKRAEVVQALNSALRRALDTAKDVAEDLRVRMRHYALFGGGIVATIVAPLAEEEEDEAGPAMVRWRQSAHERLLLPMDRPMLKRMCRVYCGEGTAASEMTDGGWKGRLLDVHIGIKGHGLGEAGVTVHMVQGRYLYCHYMQDKFNDSGWGCAYRSLQTILSWCALEKYVTFKGGLLPTHEKIQKALVAVGDKPGTSIGSKEWIGANEVCYALEKLTGVTSKILHVSSGGEMESKGRQLAQHFDEQGSPVMVGGGVLAWTILGVARNERTGKVKFLVLDPHYEGKDDLATIQNKGWVGWKAADIFKAAAFYNLCMPERPSGI